MKKILLPLLIAVALGMGFSRPVSAQDDPPGRVARLSYTDGSVSYQVSGDQDWVQADPNRPLTTGDNLWADKNSRGEIHIGSTAIRMSSETGVSFLNLDDRTVQLQLPQGVLEIHVRQLEAGDAFEVDTPNLAFTITRAGEYRIETDPNGSSTIIIVREGEGQVTGGGESYTLNPNQEYRFNGTDQLAYNAQPAPGFDDFENWSQTRDQIENNSPSAQYVSRDVDGYYDLDANGVWSETPEYGPVWVPRGVPVGWAPYHYGHWVWIAPWGWTWVDQEPWGFAPFHYGRWAFVSSNWCWVPGPLVVRPVYAPALVGFVGGGGFGLSVGFGGGFSGVAWFPLGPHDVWIPGYRSSPRYIQNVNITNTRIVSAAEVTNAYNNYSRNSAGNRSNYTYANNTNAITAVSRDTFVNAQPVDRAAVRVTDQQIRTAHVLDSAPLQPSRSSYVSATAQASATRPAVPFAQRPVVARLNPAVPVNRQTPAYTNDSRPFNRGNQNNQNNQGKQQQGWHTFTPPPSGGNNSSAPVNQNRNLQQPAGRNNAAPAQQNNAPAEQQQQQPSVRFTPPVRANDKAYDVHPPLNQNTPPAQTQRSQAPSSPGATRSAPPPHPPHEEPRPHS